MHRKSVPLSGGTGSRGGGEKRQRPMSGSATPTRIREHSISSPQCSAPQGKSGAATAGSGGPTGACPRVGNPFGDVSVDPRAIGEQMLCDVAGDEFTEGTVPPL
jgi:hypothetical protein